MMLTQERWPNRLTGLKRRDDRPRLEWRGERTGVKLRTKYRNEGRHRRGPRRPRATRCLGDERPPKPEERTLKEERRRKRKGRYLRERKALEPERTTNLLDRLKLGRSRSGARKRAIHPDARMVGLE